MSTRAWQQGILTILAVAALASSGCVATRTNPIESIPNMGKELQKNTLAEHMIEPPDVLQIDLIAAVPKPPYKLQPLDAIILRGKGLQPDSPIQGTFQVDTDGTINLGNAYGIPVTISGMTTAQAKEALLVHLRKFTRDPELEIALAQTRGMQQVRGPHLVRPDGCVWFDIYGSVRVVGMTVPEAKLAIEAHLGQFFLKPEVAISITGYNSKVFYVVFDGYFNGANQVTRLPSTGNETVLDVISQVGGMSPTADFRRIWIARPAPEGSAPQILPVDWRAITEKAEVATNYQILPGDRLFVKTNAYTTFGARLDRFLAPAERIMGFALLTVGTYQNFRFINSGGFGFGGGNTAQNSGNTVIVNR